MGDEGGRCTDVCGPLYHCGFGLVGKVVVAVDPVADLLEAMQFMMHAQLGGVAVAVGEGDGGEVVVVQVFFGDADADIFEQVMPGVVEFGAGVAGKGVMVDSNGKGALFELDGGGAGKGGEDV